MSLARGLPAMVGAAALATAAAGAADLGQDEVVSTAATVLPGSDRAVDAQRAHVLDRAAAMEASRSATRTSLASVPEAEQGAAVRDRALERLDEAAAARSEQIAQELARKRRIERMNRWVTPVSGAEITATFGDSGAVWSSDHTGRDFGASEGETVSSAAAGEVTSTEYDDSYGNTVVVTHEDGTQTWYCHLSSFSVEPGESVEAGSEIGSVGSTGNTTGPHLHMEVHPGGGAPVDPYSYLEEQGAL